MRILLTIFNACAALDMLMLIGFGGCSSGGYFVLAMNVLCLLLIWLS